MQSLIADAMATEAVQANKMSPGLLQPQPAAPPAPPAEDPHWVSVHQPAVLWEMARQQQDRAGVPSHPDAQPVAPGAYDLPPEVVSLTSEYEGSMAAAEAAPHLTAARNAALLEACMAGGSVAHWVPRPSAEAEAAASQPQKVWQSLRRHTPRKTLIVVRALA